MKRKLLLSVFLSFSFYLLHSQVPQGSNYQAIARDASGNPIAGTTLQVRLGILSDTLIPVIVWQELHSSVKTNAFGLFSVILGSGPKSGGSAATYTAVDWTVNPLFLKTEIYYSGSWKYMGTSKLWSVPYSMIAGDLDGSVKKLSVTGTTTNLEEPLFEVKNSTGQIIFAVYNEGVRVFVDDGSKGTKGGFAIGGFGSAKAPSQEYLRVTKDSTRVYVNPSGKGTKGGFAIGDFSAKSTVENFLNLTDQNYFIGHNSGLKNTTGTYNVFLGNLSGMANTSGYSNVFIGDNVGITNTSGYQNVFVGKEAGKSNVFGNSNLYLGYQSGYLSQYGSQNICIGNYSGFNNTSSQNLFIGEYSGEKNTSGTRNSFVGFFAGQENQTGQSNSYYGQFAGDKNTQSYNTYIGYWSGGSNVSGSNNAFLGFQSGQGSTSSNSVYLGYQAGLNNTGTNNVMIGYQAGSSSGAKTNALYIDNSGTLTPLIEGDFTNDRVGIARWPTTNTLEVEGTASKATAGGFIANSDRRIKTDIQDIGNSFEEVLKLHPVKFKYTQDYMKSHPSIKDQFYYNFIAQEFQQVFPESVKGSGEYLKGDPNEILQIDTYNAQIVTIKALQELIRDNQKQKEEIDNLKKELESIKSLIKN